MITRLAVTDDSNIGQSIDLVMLLELECDLSKPSRISALFLQVSVELIVPVFVGIRQEGEGRSNVFFTHILR
jgi:hypothetical protein